MPAQPALRVQELRPADRLFGKVLALGRAHASTLGFLPVGAFEERASLGQLLAATSGHELAGYVLYRTAGDRASIVHLCVADPYRGRGVAKTLVHELCRRVAHLAGVSLRCRTDYEANSLWPRIGFSSQGEVRGRSKDGHLLSCWWQGFGKPNLFSLARSDEAAALDVVADHNVWMQLVGLTAATEEVLGLEAGWMPDFEILRTPEHEVEIQRDANVQRQIETRAALKGFPCVEVPHYEAERVLPDVQGALWPGEERVISDQDRSDAMHLAYAIAAGKRSFLTVDDGILRRAAELRRVFGINVFRPAEFITHVDEYLDAAKYEPVLLRDRCLTAQRVDAYSASGLAATFLAHCEAERKHELRKRIGRLLAKPDGASVRLLTLDAEPVGVLGAERAHAKLVVQLLRFSGHQLTETISRHVLLWIVQEGVREGCTQVEIRDSARGRLVDEAAAELGFCACDGLLYKVCLTGAVPAQEIDDMIARHTDLPPSVLAHMTLEEAGARRLEKYIWPARVAGASLETVLVPIKPKWAAELFDTHAAHMTLWSPQHDLMLKTENVYYRSARSVTGLAPGSRILWYVTTDRGRRVSEIRAVSTCEEVLIADASRVFRRFRRLGVYSWHDVKTTASGDAEGKVMAIRFGMTTPVSPAVSLGDLRHLFMRHAGKTLSVRSPLRVPEPVLAAVINRTTREDG